MPTPNLSTMAQTAMSFTKEVTTHYSDRLVGSEACLACAELLKNNFEKFCDKTVVQEFSVRPGAFLGYIRVNVVLYFLGILALLGQNIFAAVLLASLAMLITVLEFFIYKEFLDPFYPAKQGKNVMGTIEPSGEVKQQVIISAHHDSAHVFNFLENEPDNYVRNILMATGSQFAMFLLTWSLLIGTWTGMEHPIAYWIITGVLAVAGIAVGKIWFFYDKNKGTPGAGDNMSCTAIAREVGKYFAEEKKNGNPLEHTRVVVASWDAEECGLRGARAYTKAHKNDLLALKTYNFNLECMYDHKDLHFLTSDLNGFVPLSSEMANEGVALAKGLDYEINTMKFPFLAGGTDAAEFAKIGVEATTLVGMSWIERGELPAYHTTRDTVEAVDEEAVKRSIALGIEYILSKDKSV